MGMSDFIPVAKTTDLSDPGQTLLEVEDRIVVLFRVNNEYFCIDDVCTHDGGPLSDGKLENHTIACPRHGAKFDIRTGKALTMPATVDTAAHDVKVEGDTIFVRICERGKHQSAAPQVGAASPGESTTLKPSAAGTAEETLTRPSATLSQRERARAKTNFHNPIPAIHFGVSCVKS